jgi:hypothetical protein
MTKLDTANFNHILADFNYLVNLEFFTDRCGHKEVQRFEEITKNYNKRLSFEEFLKKQENLNSVGPKAVKSPANKKT